MTLLFVKDLHVDFISDAGCTQILHGVNLSVAEGEMHALVGESGSGKSVTAMAIMRLLDDAGRISHGEIWLEDSPLHLTADRAMQKVRGKRIGMIFQDPMTALNPTICVGAQVAESLVYHEKLSAKQAKQQALELLADVGIASPKERYAAYPFQLSGGMCQRIAIAIALACRPSLLIADEPTTALDATVQAQILAMLQKVRQERHMGILLITHDLGVVATHCDRVSVMYGGRVVEEARVAQLFAHPQHPYVKQLLSISMAHTP